MYWTISIGGSTLWVQSKEQTDSTIFESLPYRKRGFIMKTTMNNIHTILENAQADRAAYIRSLAACLAGRTAAQPAAAESFRVMDTIEAAQASRRAYTRQMACSFAAGFSANTDAAPVFTGIHVIDMVEAAQASRCEYTFRMSREAVRKLGELFTRKPAVRPMGSTARPAV